MTIDQNRSEKGNNGLKLGLISSHMVRCGPLWSVAVISHTAQHCRQVHSNWSGVFNLLKFDHTPKKKIGEMQSTTMALSLSTCHTCNNHKLTLADNNENHSNNLQDHYVRNMHQ